jgi:lipopolysaccharide/colanic/teichoic acid biosynthesis glycosyltransferase
MHAGSDTKGHQQYFAQLMQTNTPMQKLDSRGDSRLIPGAWLLRSTGLDELPQILNVWQGEMSIVGPRPCIPYEYENYSEEQKRRCESHPGLTGLWQVSGKNRTTFEEMIRLDCDYAHKRSLLLDLRIILLTPVALFIQVGDVVRGRRRHAVAQASTNLKVGIGATLPERLARSET